ncbi:MAG: hypothetical protein ACP5KN_14560, partial [Armatimonadota bacterium]
EGDRLLVARGGDEGWSTAAQVMADHPELGTREPAPSAAAEEVIEGAAVDDWALSDREEEPEQAPVGVREPRAVPIRGMTPQHGLGRWIGQAWEIVAGDIWAFVGAVLLAGLVSLTIICAPAMQAGLTLMAIRRFRGQRVRAGTVFDGFQYFVPALVVAVIVALITAPFWIPSLAIEILTTNGDVPQSLQMIGQVLGWLGNIVSLLVGAAVFYAMPLVVDRGMTGLEALKASWTATSQRLLSYVGMTFVLQLIAQIGVLACCVGILVTAPMLPAGQVAAYMYHFRSR